MAKRRRSGCGVEFIIARTIISRYEKIWESQRLPQEEVERLRKEKWDELYYDD